MNKLYCAYARAYQFSFWVVEHFLNFDEPKYFSEPGSISKVKDLLSKEKINSCLIITDDNLFKLGLLDSLMADLDEAKIDYTVYHNVVPNPTVENAHEAYKLYLSNNCKGLIAFGGGSSMDAAKAVGALVATKNKPFKKLKGVLKIRKRIPPLIAIPTTAGTGSETTLAAVISDPEHNDKYSLMDPVLIPKYAILDPTLLVNLPPNITSTTGMDAMCHAVEAYIGRENTAKTKKYALEAIKLIYENLLLSYKEPQNLTYRENMQVAAFKAGVAFTRAYVGYVHSLAHSLGAVYNAPHGMAIAIILPHVLKSYGKSAHRKLAKIYDYLGLKDEAIKTRKQKANFFIQIIIHMNKQMNIPPSLRGIVEKKDIPLLAAHAAKEANPLYPVPKIMNRKELEEIYKKIMKAKYV
ncbi:MAG: iron-containing alcohol dehydrogenase [Bacilli bacterium]